MRRKKQRERERERERKLKKILQVLYTENNLDTFTMEVPIYIYIQSKRESMREIGNCLTRAVTDSHMYNTRNNRLTVNNITTHTQNDTIPFNEKQLQHTQNDTISFNEK